MKDTLIHGMSITKMWVDEWTAKPEHSMNLDDYEIRRFGKKEYSAHLKSGRYEVLKAVYKCSRPEAVRRWTMVLINRRMMI